MVREHSHAIRSGMELLRRLMQEGLTVDITVETVMQGHASGLDDVKVKLRAAFERWLEWALAMPSTDLKHPSISSEIKRMAPE